MERQFTLYVDNKLYGPVWLTNADMSQLEPLRRAVSGLRRWRLKMRPNVIYVEIL